MHANCAESAHEYGWRVTAIGVGVPECIDASGRLRSRGIIAWDRSRDPGTAATVEQVLGGVLAASGEQRDDLVRAAQEERSRPHLPPIRLAVLGAKSGVFGAGLAALTSEDA